ncbi:MAG: sterol desaturase family protein [Bacteroidota bacterium]
MTFFLLLESGVPLFRFKYNRWKHLGLNLFFTFTTILVNFAMAFILLSTSFFVQDQGFGILQWVAMPIGLTLVVGLLLLDLIGAYTAHWVEHHVKWMWQFHVIHHTDQEVDASTANRHHPGESVIRFLFTTLAVLIVGAPVWLIMLYQAMSATLSQFNHSNTKMPTWLDDALMWVICTPNMHRVHHHYRQPYSDSNYGNIFSIWDRLFRTFVRVDNEKLVYGVDTYMDQTQVGSMWSLMKIPFQGYREHVKYDKPEQL